MKILEKLKKILNKIKNFFKKKTKPFSPLTGDYIDDSDDSW